MARAEKRRSEPSGDYAVTGETPIGTLAEMEELGLSATQWASCTKPVAGSEGEGIRGCPYWAKCVFSKWKGKTGPHYVGVRIAKKGKALFHRLRSCYDYMAMDFPLRMQGRRIVANEGDTVLNMETVPLNPSPTGNNPDKRMITGLVEIVVPKYPRPAESMATLLGAEQAYKEMEEASIAEEMKSSEQRAGRRGPPGGGQSKEAG